MGLKWTPERIDCAIETLREHNSVRAACTELGVTLEALDKALRRASKGPPSTHLHKAPKVERTAKDHVQEHVKRSNEQHLRSVQKDLIDELQQEKARNAFIADVSANRPPPRILPRERSSGLREATPVILASDWHLGELVTYPATSGRNEFNMQIAEHRAHRFFNGIEWLIGHNRQSFQIRDVILWLGGDFMSGYIHDELVETNTMSPNQEVCFAFGILSDGIRHLLQDPKLERIVVPCSHGNHGRSTEKRRIKTGAQNSFEWLMYCMLANAFKGEKRLQFVIDESAHQYVDAYEFNLHFHHGDEVKFGGGVGGVAIPLMKRVAGWDSVRPCHYHHVGHFHQYLDFGKCVVNGSLIGYSDYAMAIGAKYEHPQQAFYLLDSKRGKTGCFPLWVSDDPKGPRSKAQARRAA